MKNRNIKNPSLFRRGYNFIHCISKGSVLQSSLAPREGTDIEKFGMTKPGRFY